MYFEVFLLVVNNPEYFLTEAVHLATIFYENAKQGLAEVHRHFFTP